MKHIIKTAFALLGLASLTTSVLHAQTTLRVSGSTTVNPVVSEAAEVLRKEKDMAIVTDTIGGSTGGINALGDGRADLAMSSRALKESDFKKFPEVHFQPIHIGQDAVSMVVSKDVWEGGIHALSIEKMRKIYESTATNWKEFGGPDRRIVFFNKEQGRGTWEVFIHWLYGKAEKAPRVNHPEVGANAEVRSKVSATKGAISFVSTPWADGKSLFPLAIELPNHQTILAKSETIRDHSYPLSRPLYVITNGKPAGNAKILIDYLLSEAGQVFVAKNGYLKLSDLK